MASGPSSYQEAEQRIKNAYRDEPGADRFMLRIRALCLKRLARDYGKPIAWLWYDHVASKK